MHKNAKLACVLMTQQFSYEVTEDQEPFGSNLMFVRSCMENNASYYASNMYVDLN